MKFASVICLFVFLYSASAIHGTYRQCDFNTGDETFLEIGPGPDFHTKMTFLFGGCLDGIVQYQVDAEFQLIFGDDRPDGGSDVELHYSSAVATAFTDDAVNALSNTCGSRFSKEQPRNVLGCLFCPIRYDIYLQLEEGIFVLGDSIACNVADRPTQYEESKYVLLPYYNEVDDGDDFPDYNTFTGTFTYVNVDDDLDDDFYEDEDDENIAQDDDDEYVARTTDLSTFTYTVLNTFSNSPGDSSSGAASLSVAFAALFAVAFILI